MTQVIGNFLICCYSSLSRERYLLFLYRWADVPFSDQAVFVVDGNILRLEMPITHPQPDLATPLCFVKLNLKLRIDRSF
jgi:hypothetical protein